MTTNEMCHWLDREAEIHKPVTGGKSVYEAVADKLREMEAERDVLLVRVAAADELAKLVLDDTSPFPVLQHITRAGKAYRNIGKETVG